MSKARITYRFDQSTSIPSLESKGIETTETNEERDKGKVIPLYQEDETARIERLIRGASRAESSSPPRITEESEDNIPLYYTSKDEEISYERIPFYEEVSSSSPMIRKARRRINWLGLTTSIAGAVLTGILLGMFVLSMFQGDEAASDTTPDSAELGDASLQTPATDLEETIVSLEGFGQTESASAAELHIPGRTYYLVQNGVFSTPEGAELAASQLKDKGFAGAVEGSAEDQLIVYAGAAVNRDDALLISQQIQGEGLEVYIKPYDLPPVERLNWTAGDTGGLQAYLLNSQQLIEQFIAVSVQQLNQTVPAKLEDRTISSLREAHQQWTTAANQIVKDAPSEMKSFIQEMNTSINSTMLSIEQYQKKPLTAYLWQVQSAVTEYLIQYKELLS
jgi:stage II sporulation protein B